MNHKPAAINSIWLGMILVATITAAYTGKMDAVTKASFESAKAAVTLAIHLIGPMALWLGLMKVAEDGGMLRAIARFIRPVMVRLFPSVPPEHPAMSAMIMNMSANALGLGNAATPMGIKAMRKLKELSCKEGIATNAMCLFLAINTSNVTLLPLGVITVRAAAGCHRPADILFPTLLATSISTLVAIVAAKWLEKRGGEDFVISPEHLEATVHADGELGIDAKEDEDHFSPSSLGKIFIVIAVSGFCLASLARLYDTWSKNGLSFENAGQLSSWLIPILISFFLIYGFLKGVRVYESLTVGAKEGFDTAVRIIPFMVAIFVAIGMLRASGAMDLFVRLLSPVVDLIGMPPEALAMALMRPLSGSGAFGIMSEIVNRQPNSFLSFVVSVMQGSTETTFYVLAVYFGSVGITKTRHALSAALLADGAGILASVWLSRLFY